MRGIVIGVAAAAILGAGAYYGLFVLPSQQLRAGLDQTIATLPPGYTVKYGGASFSLPSHTAVITDLTIQGPGAIDEHIAKLTVKQPTLDFVDQWNRARANSGALKPDEALPIAERIAVEGVKIVVGPFNGNIASASLDRPRIYPWALLHDGLLPWKDFGTNFTTAIQAQRDIGAREQALLKQQQNGEDAEQQDATRSAADMQTLQNEQIDALLPLIKYEAAGLLGVGFDGFDSGAAEFASSIAGAGSTPPGIIHVAIGKIHEGALDRAIGGANTVDGLVEKVDPDVNMSIDHASVGNIVARDFMTRLLNGDPPSLAMLDGTTIGPMEMDGTTMTLPTGQVVRIQKLALLDTVFGHSSLKSLAFTVTGFTMNVADMDARSKAGMQQLGLTSLTLNAGLAFQSDSEKKTASLHDTMLSFDGLGSIQLDADLVNYDPFRPVTDAQVGFSKVVLRYKDDSLIDKVLSAGAKRTPAQLAQMRQAYAANLLLNLGPLVSDQKLAGSVKAINDFARTPQNLTVTLAPPAPVPLGSVKTIAAQGPQALVDTLGLSITSNR